MYHIFGRIQKKKGESQGKRVFFSLLIGIALILVFISFNSSSARDLDSIQADDTAGMLIYKTFGEPVTDLQPLPAPCEGDNCIADSIPYYKPFSGTSSAEGSRSGLEVVSSPEMWPFSPTVKIFSHWPSGTTTTCSGMMVEAKYVLTAAHCVYSHLPENCPEGEDACWVDDIEAVPAYQDGSEPYGESGYQTILAWTDWTESQNADFDLAVVQLRYPIGASIGWLGVGFNTDDSYFTNNIFTSTSYPEESPHDGEYMYDWTGTVDDAASSSEILYLDQGCDAGQLGATLNGDNGIVYGIYSFDDSGSQTGVTRITYSKFDSIRTFIEVGQPKSGPDLAAYDVHVRSKWNFPGQKLSGVDFYLLNYSTSTLPENTYQIDIYLSTDNLISDNVILLNSYLYEGTLEPDQVVRVSIPPEVELKLPDVIHGSEPNGGIFYISVIVQPVDGEVNTDNNRSVYYQPEPVWINDSDNSNYLFPVFSR